MWIRFNRPGDRKVPEARSLETPRAVRWILAIKLFEGNVWEEIGLLKLGREPLFVERLSRIAEAF